MTFVIVGGQLKIFEKIALTKRTDRSFMIDETVAEQTNWGIDKIEYTGTNRIKKITKGLPFTGSPFYDDLS